MESNHVQEVEESELTVTADMELMQINPRRIGTSNIVFELMQVKTIFNPKS